MAAGSSLHPKIDVFVLFQIDIPLAILDIVRQTTKHALLSRKKKKKKKHHLSLSLLSLLFVLVPSSFFPVTRGVVATGRLEE